MNGPPFWRRLTRLLSRDDLRQELRSFGRWSLVAPFVMAILFACGQMALLRPSGMAAADTGSLIQADYSLWPAQAFAPLEEEIIPEIQRENDQLPEQIVISGNYYPSLTLTPGLATPTALPGTTATQPNPQDYSPPPPATATPTDPPHPDSPARTATPTRSVPPSPYPAPAKTATSTLRPAATATRIPSLTPRPSPTRTRTPSATPTRTPTRTATQPLPLVTSTASKTPSLTPSLTSSPSPTLASATPTSTPSKTATSSPTATSSATLTRTPTHTATPTLSPTPTSTRTPTFTPSATADIGPVDSPTPTITPTPSITPTPTDTPTDTPMPSPTDTPTPLPLPPHIDIGDPDGDINDIQCGSGEIIDLGAQVWIGTLILYEFYNPAGCNGGICLDWVYIDLSASAEGPWTQVFYWGDTNDGNNGNVQAYHFPGGVELDNENIPIAELLNNSGILIGVGGTYRYVRLTAPTPCGDPAQVDSIDYLP